MEEELGTFIKSGQNSKDSGDAAICPRCSLENREQNKEKIEKLVCTSEDYSIGSAVERGDRGMVEGRQDRPYQKNLMTTPSEEKGEVFFPALGGEFQLDKGEKKVDRGHD